MVPFADFEMPVQYAGIIKEHDAVRHRAGLFDLSHMGQFWLTGENVAQWADTLTINAVETMKPMQARYNIFCNDGGGAHDDTIFYRLEKGWLLVVNAANRQIDFAWLVGRGGKGVDLRDLSADYALLAVAGPHALERLGLSRGRAFTFEHGSLDGVEVMICATGYTGEEAGELACMPEDAVSLWDAIIARGVTPCGLGARDTLRLEVCYPLHGNDIDETRDPISAGLRFACALETEFTGVEALREISAHGPAQRLVAFTMIDTAIPRKGMAIEGGGEVTSGSLSPMLDVGIGLGYVPAELHRPGTDLSLDVRGRSRRARVAAKPIYRREE